jgi:hypothetical protein
MKYPNKLLLALLLFPSFSFAQTQAPFEQRRAANEKCKASDPQLAALIEEYRGLRERRRRLPAGKFDNDLSGHGGRLHEVLSALGPALGHPPETKQNLQACLGEPDAIRSGQRMNNFLEIYLRERRKAGKEPLAKRKREYLIYFWRGWHDFIFFVNEGGHIVDYGWWFAYE